MNTATLYNISYGWGAGRHCCAPCIPLAGGARPGTAGVGRAGADGGAARIAVVPERNMSMPEVRTLSVIPPEVANCMKNR